MGCARIDTVLRISFSKGRQAVRPHRLARSRTSDFHSANRGSNPLGVIFETLAQW